MNIIIIIIITRSHNHNNYNTNKILIARQRRLSSSRSGWKPSAAASLGALGRRCDEQLCPFGLDSEKTYTCDLELDAYSTLSTSLYCILNGISPASANTHPGHPATAKRQDLAHLRKADCVVVSTRDLLRCLKRQTPQPGLPFIPISFPIHQLKIWGTHCAALDHLRLAVFKHRSYKKTPEC